MIFIDHLSLKSCLSTLRLIRGDKLSEAPKSVHVLDPIKNTFIMILLQKCMSLFGISLKEADFFTGHLRTLNGESIAVAAPGILNHIAFETAKRTVNKSNILKALNEQWGRNLIILYLAKYSYRIGEAGGHRTIHKILVADALSRDRCNETHRLVLGLPLEFDADLFEAISGSVNLHTYLIKEWSLINSQLSVLLLIVFVGFKRFLKRTASIFQHKPDFGNVVTPALLLAQEDELSMDRSYRGQPHWLFQKDKSPNFRTLVLASGIHRNMELDYDELSKDRVYYVPKDAIYCYSGKHPVQKSINSAMRALLYESLFGSQVPKDYAFQLAMLFMKASLLSDFCIGQKVRAFMTAENYHITPSAMNLIGPNMNVHTFSYQYSNMSEIGPQMMSTADTMCSFSPLFHERWSNNGIQPKSFIDVGYIFDSSFSLVAERASELRKQLENNGSQFTICYFDESVQNDKYGCISINDHYNEILSLVKLVIQDSSIAVIVKSQFQQNSPSVLFQGYKIIESATDSGRWFELCHGNFRNNNFPAEAAMASDIVISHAVGATAGLEAAWAGSRCILLNPYDMQGSNVEIFKKADILYNNMDSALNAVSFFRQGRNEYQNLGNWEAIIDLFDSYRDGRSSNRMRALLEKKIVE
jgi:hypothetical protein